MHLTRRELLDALRHAVSPLYDPAEVASVALVAAEALSGVGRAGLLADPAAQATVCEERYRHALHDLAAGRPVQYVVGETLFCGLRLRVREGVLIPRPETEELVEWVATRCRGGESLLDVGTGSGAIALALAARVPRSRVVAFDRSPQALAVARENAALHGIGLRLMQGDALGDWQPVAAFGPYDIIVSNPPYIPHGERAALHPNVREWEPPEALFTPDDDPLLFYRAIARHAKGTLKPQGALYFEIHERQADSAVDLLRREGFAAVELRRDGYGKPRMIACQTL